MTKVSAAQPRVSIGGEVLRQIRQHARSCSKTEVCGVLIGREDGKKLSVDASIAGLNAAQAGTHVTFTQDTWEHIYKIKDSQFPDERVVGWYHSHPGFGVFLSDHDTFIHKNFFSSPLQVAWVYDPHSDEEGCFGWVGNRLERLSEISIEDGKGGEEAGETGKPEPVGVDESEEEETSQPKEDDEAPKWARWTFAALTHLTILLAGFLIAWYLFPRVLIVPVDPRTGEPVGRPVELRELMRAPSKRDPPANDSAAPAIPKDNKDSSGPR